MLRRNISVLLSLVFLFHFPNDLFSQQLKIYHIDVEQADATLLISPGGKSMLIDSGKNGHGSRIGNILRQEGINHIDFYVCTHYHEDHYGGIDDIVNDDSITVGLNYDRGDKDYIPQTKINGPTYQGYQNAVGRNAVHLTRGMSIPFDDNISVQCISSGGVVLAEEEPQHAHNENDMSISLLIKYGSFWYFNGGDIETPTEVKIASRDFIQNVDVYKASHHGSNSSSSRELMMDMKPDVIIISNGNNGRYMHPRQVILDLYASLNPTPLVLQTNKYFKGGLGGNVPDQFIADLELNETDGSILIEVDQSTDQYVISYRDTSISRSIKSRVETNTALVIESLMPNPEGNDIDLEEVSIRNTGNTSIQLAGAVLRDEGGRIWPLDQVGSIAPNQSVTIRRNGMPMSLNNNGDTIYLIGNCDQVIDEYSYTSSQEGRLLVTDH